MIDDPYADYKAKHGPGPFITCDAVVTRGNRNGTFWDILLIRRGKEPFKGLLALPGGFMEPNDPSIVHGAVRELREETGLDVWPSWARGSIVCDGINRDPRARIIGVATHFEVPPGVSTTVEAADDAEKDSAVWYDVRSIVSLDASNMAFDHQSTIREILK